MSDNLKIGNNYLQAIHISYHLFQTRVNWVGLSDESVKPKTLDTPGRETQ